MEGVGSGIARAAEEAGAAEARRAAALGRVGEGFARGFAEGPIDVAPGAVARVPVTAGAVTDREIIDLAPRTFTARGSNDPSLAALVQPDPLSAGSAAEMTLRGMGPRAEAMQGDGRLAPLPLAAPEAGPVTAAAVTDRRIIDLSPGKYGDKGRVGPLAAAAPARLPAVEGVVMRRGAPGSGTYGERGDLSPVTVRRMEPMSVAEGVRSGIVRLAPKAEGGPLGVETPAERAMVAGLRAGRDRAMEMTSPAARAMRERWDSGRGVSGPVSATGGRPSAGKMERMARSGIAFDPASGGWTNVGLEEARGRETVGVQRNVIDAEVEGEKLRNDAARVEIERQKLNPETLGRVDDKGLMEMAVKYGRPARVTPKKLGNVDAMKYQDALQKGDQAGAQAVLDAASEEWTADAQAAYGRVREEMKRRGIGDGGAAGSGRGTGDGRRGWREKLGRGNAGR